jgi:hypothetical protein
VDKETPQNQIAVRFYADDTMVLERHLPQRISRFLNISWFGFIAYFVILIPTMSLIISYRTFLFDIVPSQYYFQLLSIYGLSGEVKTKEEFEELFSKFFWGSCPALIFKRCAIAASKRA